MIQVNLGRGWSVELIKTNSDTTQSFMEYPYYLASYCGCHFHSLNKLLALSCTNGTAVGTWDTAANKTDTTLTS